MTYHAILSETGDVYGSGATAEEAVQDAIREVLSQGGIGPEPHQWNDEAAFVAALELATVTVTWMRDGHEVDDAEVEGYCIADYPGEGPEHADSDGIYYVLER